MASDSIGTASIEIEADADDFESDVRSKTSNSKALGEEAGRGVGEGFKAGLTVLVGEALLEMGKMAAGAVKDFVVGATNAASDLQETATAIEAVFGAESAANIQAWAQSSATALGQSTQQALDAAKNFAVFGQSAGLTGSSLESFSTDLTKAASDMASFHNADPTEVIEAIGAGLRGESEPLRRFGVLMDDAALKAKAMELGIGDGTSTLTQQQKVLAAQALILGQVGAATDDFTETSGGLANQQRIMAAQWANLQASIGQLFLPVAQLATTAINQILGSLIPLSEELVGKAVPAIQAFADTILGAFSEGGIAGVLASLSSMRDGILETIIGSLPSIIEGIASFLPTAIGAIVNSAVQMWTGIITALTAVIPEVVSALGAAIPEILSALLSAIPTILDGALQMFTGIITALTTIIPQIVTTLVALIPQIITALITALPLLIQGAIALFQGIITGLTTAIPLILNAVLQLLPVLATALIGMLPALIEAAIQLFTALVEGVLTVVPDIIVAVLTLLPELINTLLGMLPSLIQSAIELFLGIVTAIVSAIPDILVALLEMLPQLISTLLQMIPQLITAAITLFLGIVTGLVQAIPTIIGALLDLIPQMVSALIGAAPQLLDAGVQAIQGFIDGIVSMASAVWDAAVGVVEGAIEGVKDFLGIASPSRLLRDIGKDTGQGYIDGIDAMAKDAQKAMEEMVTPPPAPSLEPSAAALGRPGATTPGAAGAQQGWSGAGGNAGLPPTAPQDIDINVIGDLHPERTARAVADALAEKVAVVAA
ncbi:tape measure protein [Microbacterium phage Megan]|uniref:Tape measure protein n=1 Tax=Microbacterium phage Megan TaxID=2656551 RepID=A0A649VJZ0_9CAUD|nr:tape measure protein [Microbacterium phage Megan]QGJ92700.1 tape measure protein [Microbacterium phage Megan]